MEKLFERDSYLTVFSAAVVRCTPGKHGWDVTLTRTAFFPESGGQPWDTGVLGPVRVTRVHQRGDEVVHCCDGPLSPGQTVEGQVDFPRRFDLMQQHSGEHVLSGLAHTLFGCDNVGFHLGADVTTVDLSLPLTSTQLSELEEQVNRYLWEDHPVHVAWPAPGALAHISYRSKRSLEGPVRIVTFPGADICACCGTHVSSSAQVGLVKLLDAQSFRGGTRLTVLCGGRALAYLNEAWAQNRQVSGLLSAKPLETGQAVARLLEDAQSWKTRCAQLEDGRFTHLAKNFQGMQDVLLFEEGLTPDGLRRLTDAVLEVCSGRAACFSGGDGTGYQYAVGRREGGLGTLPTEMNAALGGRGGGTPGFIQGKITASRREIEDFFQNYRDI